MEMQNWYVGAIRDYCRAHDALNMHREGCFAEDVETAIETLGLDEVHHGINAANSPRVMKPLADRKITLNVCPTSNIMLGYANNYAEHLIKILVENGVPVTINTDDLLIFDSSVNQEYLRLYEAGTLTAEQLDQIRYWGLYGE